MQRKQWLAVVVMLVLGALALSACAQATPQPVEVVKEVQVTVEVTKEVVQQVEVTKEVVKEVQVTPTPGPEPVTYYGYETTDIPGLDPQVGEDAVSINMIENLFVNLTNFDLADIRGGTRSGHQLGHQRRWPHLHLPPPYRHPLGAL